jgi:hypothetical protein
MDITPITAAIAATTRNPPINLVPNFMLLSIGDTPFETQIRTPDLELAQTAFREALFRLEPEATERVKIGACAGCRVLPQELPGEEMAHSPADRDHRAAAMFHTDICLPAHVRMGGTA